MDGRQVQDVESHPRDIGQTVFRLAERRTPARLGTGGAREHLVPRTHPCALAIDGHREHRLGSRRARSIRRRRGHRRETRVERVMDAVRLWQRAANALSALEQPVPLRRPAGCVAQQLRAFEQLTRDVLTGVRFCRETLPPAGEGIHPRVDHVFGHAELAADMEGAFPRVVAKRRECHFFPRIGGDGARWRRSEPDDRREHIVPVDVDHGRDVHGLAWCSFDGEAAPVDRWLHLFDDHASCEVIRKCTGCCLCSGRRRIGLGNFSRACSARAGFRRGRFGTSRTDGLRLTDYGADYGLRTTDYGPHSTFSVDHSCRLQTVVRRP